jgi:DNA primase small subunit
MPLTEKDWKFLQFNYAIYYQQHFAENLYVTDLESREFAIERWASTGSHPAFERHLGFPNPPNLYQFIKDFTPRHLYASAGHYRFPDEPSMTRKLWKDEGDINCDLIFDIDIDHIFTECKYEHDIWVCKTCGMRGRGPAPTACENVDCTSRNFTEIKWECPDCMEVAKEQIIYLVEEILVKDFGLDSKNPKDLFVVFSGRRGYHVHVERDITRHMDSKARTEIADYVTGTGLDPQVLGITSAAQKKPSTSESGWRGRMACLTLQYIQTASDTELHTFFRRQDLNALRRTIVQDLQSPDPTWRYPNVSYQTIYQVIAAAVARFAPHIDKPVTTDIHRLIRVPGSLHGKTGFLVKKLTFSELEHFDPFSDAQVFAGQVLVHVSKVPKLTFGGVEYGPYREQAVLLPLNVAIYLMSREVATISPEKK